MEMQTYKTGHYDFPAGIDLLRVVGNQRRDFVFRTYGFDFFVFRKDGATLIERHVVVHGYDDTAVDVNL
jgi:hypothetical protein